MSLELLNQFEIKVQETVSTIQLLQRQIEILKHKNNELEELINEESIEFQNLQKENEKLKKEQIEWQERIFTLLNTINEISEVDNNNQ